MEIASPYAAAAPKVSAILIVRDQASELHRAVEALERSQSRELLEILVVDCASTDNTADIDQSYPSVTVLRLPHDFGDTKAMNIATRTAKGDFLFFLNPAIEVAPHTVAHLAERLDADNTAAAVCPMVCDESGKPLPQIHDLPDRENVARLADGSSFATQLPDLSQESVENPYPGHTALLVRKQFVAGMNYFDQRFGHYWADADLAIRIRRAQKRIRLYPSIPVVYHASTTAEDTDGTSHRADRILGAAVLLSKHYGYLSGLTFRIGAVLKALMRFDFALFGALLSGEKMDGASAG